MIKDYADRINNYLESYDGRIFKLAVKLLFSIDINDTQTIPYAIKVYIATLFMSNTKIASNKKVSELTTSVLVTDGIDQQRTDELLNKYVIQYKNPKTGILETLDPGQYRIFNKTFQYNPILSHIISLLNYYDVLSNSSDLKSYLDNFLGIAEKEFDIMRFKSIYNLLFKNSADDTSEIDDAIKDDYDEYGNIVVNVNGSIEALNLNSPIKIPNHLLTLNSNTEYKETNIKTLKGFPEKLCYVKDENISDNDISHLDLPQANLKIDINPFYDLEQGTKEIETIRNVHLKWMSNLAKNII